MPATVVGETLRPHIRGFSSQAKSNDREPFLPGSEPFFPRRGYFGDGPEVDFGVAEASFGEGSGAIFAAMGSSKRHRERGEASEEAPPPSSSAPAASSSSSSRHHREHKKHKHRSGGGGGGGGSSSSAGSKRSGSRAERSRQRRGGGGEEGPSSSSSSSQRRQEAERRPKREKRDDGHEQAAQGAASSSKSSSGDASLSIEETNKLRAKLGLKPLEINSIKKETGSKEEPVAAEVINPIVLRQREEIREKLAPATEKRLLTQTLGCGGAVRDGPDLPLTALTTLVLYEGGLDVLWSDCLCSSALWSRTFHGPSSPFRKVKSLGEDDPWLDDTAAWIERSRKLQVEKELAEKRAKLLEEMDQEFGISSLVEEEFGQKKKQVGYSSRDLKGLTVEHTIDSFQEGETVILTLKDKGVLEEKGGDVLVNVNMVDREKAKKNVELRKKKAEYKPYEEEESVDDMVMLKHKGVLSKYDEEIDGERKKSFKLDAVGMADGSWERELQQIRDNLQNRAQTLDVPGLRLATEYFTPEEMDVTFKKTKRRVKKIRKKEKPVKAADLLPLNNEGNSDRDFGSRIRGRGRRKVVQEEEEEEDEEGEEERYGYGRNGAAEDVPPSDDLRVERMEISSDEDDRFPGADSPTVLEEDEAEQELQKQLEKGRKLRQIQQLKDSGEKVIEIVKKLDTGRSQEDDEELEKKGAIVFNATSEFCRTLGEIPTYGLAGNREDQEELMDFERDDERSANGGSDSDGEENIGWSTVNLDEEKQQQDFSASSTTILDEEPIVNRGLAAALMLCQNKGLLETTVQKVARVKAPNKSLPSAVYCIEDKMAIDDKYSRREEYRGFTQDFKEKDGYKPDVKIEYVDETGRKLTPKEAFRQLSHRFHGKGSGKMKTERRMKKLDEEALLKKMSSSDTPLGTVALLQEKQKAQKTPYIVLSGSGKSMNANTITK
nr:PREDICTED: U4/U6.U5 tri-snRNP-associated protein 1 [Anolis carolinensis]|eukprot:XP_016854475.1 PREDICTED: U4/U6.U5 tri-snRNP-associated protein 1 [Anolis carolinensis]